MRTPIWHPEGGGFVFVWEGDQVAADVRRIHESGPHVRAEVVWRSIAPDAPSHLHAGVLNLTSTAAKASVEKALEARLPDIDWGRIVEQLTRTCVLQFRKGEPAVPLRTTGEESFLIPLAIEPFIYERLPFVFFGEPGSGKSFLGLWIAALAATEGGIRGTPLEARRRFAPLYLDWESNELDLRNRVRRIELGMGTSLDELIYYRRCAGPLSRSAEEIAGIMVDLSLDFLVIDSLGPAAGGDLNSPQSALEFFEALRHLDCTSLIIAHCAKNSDSRSIFGSQFFTAHARGIAQVRPFQEAGEDELCVGIYHTKSNVSRIVKPFGLRFHFDGDEGPVTVRPQDLGAVPKLAATLSVSTQIVDALVREGALRPVDLSEMLGIPAGTVRTTLGRLRDKGKVVKRDDGTYGAATKEDEVVPF